ncbi:MAG: hypothetical protein QNJ51_26350 [Calothrix sp. MO_167.B12]|nr:hypothetical protein [Calothrix sp. MO_167.B12]
MSNSSSQSWQSIHVPSNKGYYVYQHGCHLNATFMRVYVPEAVAAPGTDLKAIIYLHGFALCMPYFYEAHLVELVKKGYIVFFPDFQNSLYPNTLSQVPTPSQKPFPYLQKWRALAKLSADKLANAHSTKSSTETPLLTTDDIDSVLSGFEAYERGDLDVKGELSQFSARELQKVARSMIFITILLTVISWFRREYGKNLIHLLSTVALSLVHSPEKWLKNGLSLTENAWNYLCKQPQYSHWNKDNLDTFAFGHSLGGLIALSAPCYLKEHSSDSQVLPKKIVVSDPTPTTENGIPGFVICILRLFCVPFVMNPLKIQSTGKSLTEPVAILHGNSDTLVPPGEWVDGNPSNYDAIASQEKAIYFSYNSQVNPQLVAFHNQAVTSTQYYGDGLFRHFGGVKNGPNAYNREYVWPGADKIFMGEASPRDLLHHLDTPDFQVKPTPSNLQSNPPNLLKRLALIVGIMLLLGVGYWVWKTNFLLKWSV